MNNSLLKAERLAKTKGVKGWAALFLLLGLCLADQFLYDVPYENLIFPVLVICAASMSLPKNFVFIAIYAVLFELSCLAWFPARLITAKWWLLQVFIGYFMPYLAYKAFNPKHKNVSVFVYGLYAAIGEVFYFWTSVAATVIIWKMPLFPYLLADAPYELRGALATFICALPIAFVYKLTTGEIKLKRRNANEQKTTV